MLQLQMDRIIAAFARLAVVAALLSLPACWKAPSQPETMSETWDACFLQGSRIGYAHTTVRCTVRQDLQTIQTESVVHVAIRREGQTSTQDIVIRFDDKGVVSSYTYNTTEHKE